MYTLRNAVVLSLQAFEVRASAVRIAGGCHECGKPELAALLLMAGTRVSLLALLSQTLHVMAG